MSETADKAHAEAERRYPSDHIVYDPFGATGEAQSDPYGYEEYAREAFIAGAQWQASRKVEVASDTSDGYHTFDELYHYRMLYNAHAAQGWLAASVPVVKSWRHSDGELAFGGGWFVVSAQLSTGQVTNHYEAEHWDLFDVPEVEKAPAWDGHTPAIAAERLSAAALGGGEHE